MHIKIFSLLMFFLCIQSPSAIAGWFSPDNYWECILKEMQHVQTDTIAQSVVDTCKQNHPFHERIFIEKKSSWFGPKTAQTCVLKHGKHVQTEIGARYIQSACYKLYPDD